MSQLLKVELVKRSMVMIGSCEARCYWWEARPRALPPVGTPDVMATEVKPPTNAYRFSSLKEILIPAVRPRSHRSPTLGEPTTLVYQRRLDP